MTDPSLQQLCGLGEELRQVFADERRAIAALDHGALESLAAHKERIASALAELRDSALASSPAARDLFAAIRVEAQATAMLAATATEAVRALLGYQTTGAYDRRARQTSTVSPRLRAAY